MNDYQAFLASKRLVHPSSGHDVPKAAIHGRLFPFQADAVRWALRKGRAAMWLTTGMGKTLIQVEWCRHLHGTKLIVAPLAVAQQTVRLAWDQLGVVVKYVRSPTEMDVPGIYATNYEMLRHFLHQDLDGLVLDEASILAAIDGQTRKLILEHFTHVPYRLSCTATPMPNDISELAGQAQYLGIMTREQMLATFFVHDETGWRLRGHARQPFCRWLASWAIAMNNPEDLGYDGSAFVLPPLEIREVVIKTDWTKPGELFPGRLQGITDRADVRQRSIQDRIHEVARLAQGDEQVIVWVGLNDEASACMKAIPDAVEVKGNDPLDSKIERLMGFAEGRYRVLVSKPTICGFGMNWQGCHRVIFMGLGDSWQAYYQAIRRCYRYGQQHPVVVDVVVTDHEAGIVENVWRKERESLALVQGIIDAGKGYERMELRDERSSPETYATAEYEGHGWRLLQGDACERMRALPEESVDLSVFSPPFLSLYSYSPTERDLGNSRSETEFFRHFGYIIDELLRLTKPGRLACVHVSQVPAMLVRDGYIGLKDFRGKTIEAFLQHGWIFHGDITIDKNPQVQAIRMHAKGLMFVQLKKDASWLRPGLADYLLVFRKPGENAVPILPEIDNETWIQWAHPVWYDIRETDTLSTSEAKSDEDDKHICALQLPVIERCIRLWSNPGETVASPFAGIGSEGYEAIRLGRRFLGVELKPLYCRAAVRNLQRAEQLGHTQVTMNFSGDPHDA